MRSHSMLLAAVLILERVQDGLGTPYDNARAIVLLIDERPEEATAWREALPVAELAIATAELAPIEQVRVAELALDRARRLAEDGINAVLVCDSLSRLAVEPATPMASWTSRPAARSSR